MAIEFADGARVLLYMCPGACSQVTMSALEEARVDYRERMVDLPAGEQKSPSFLAINPKGKVPAIDVDGRLVTENAAILWMLHRGRPGAMLFPDEADGVDWDQGLIDLIWCTGTLHPIVRQIRAPGRYTGGDTTGVHDDGVAKFTRESRLLEERLSGGRWWYGGTWSIIDVYLRWLAGVAEKGGFALDAYPALRNHMERVSARPSFQRAAQREAAMLAGPPSA